MDLDKFKILYDRFSKLPLDKKEWESEEYNEETCPGTIFHILLPQREEPPDEKIAKLFSPAKKSTGRLASSQVETAGNDMSGKY